MPQQQHKNGESAAGGQSDYQDVRDNLDIQARIISSSSSNPLLRETNLGLGKYDDSYKWQQIRSYRKGLYAWIAFGRTLSERKVYETKLKLGEEGYNAIYDNVDSDVKQFDAFDESDWSWDAEETSRWTAVRARGEWIWTRLGEPNEVISDEQFAALANKTGVVDEWQPLFWELVAGRHEMSRSEGAELLRDALTGVNEYRGEAQEEESLL